MPPNQSQSTSAIEEDIFVPAREGDTDDVLVERLAEERSACVAAMSDCDAMIASLTKKKDSYCVAMQGCDTLAENLTKRRKTSNDVGYTMRASNMPFRKKVG